MRAGDRLCAAAPGAGTLASCAHRVIGASRARRGLAALCALSLCAAGCSARTDPPNDSASAQLSTRPSASASASETAAPRAAPQPPPACEEASADPGPWERAIAGRDGFPRVVAGEAGRSLGGFTQAIEGRGTVRLRFLGTHVFDLLDKLSAEGGASEDDRRRMICAVLNEAAKSGAPVVRIWGSLKRTGSAAEIEQARDLLALVLDEDARRRRPLRFVVSLLNHQPGYGLPDPEASLDDQKAPGWSARDVYLGGSWRRPGAGQIAERIARYRDEPRIRESPYVLVWELVNELDTHRSVAHGSLAGSEARDLVGTFLVPAAAMLAQAFPQPIALGDLRGDLGAYEAFAEGAVGALGPEARGRLAWTTHVYVDTEAKAPSASERKALEEAGTRKLDLDVAVARKLGLPLFLGEIGQHVRGAKAAYCGGGAAHDVPELLSAVLAPDADPAGRRDIEAAIFWGEGMCGLAIPSAAGEAERRVSIGAGGDSADLGPDEAAARAKVREARRWARFVLR
jgi:hypothetical protein